MATKYHHLRCADGEWQSDTEKLWNVRKRRQMRIETLLWSEMDPISLDWEGQGLMDMTDKTWSHHTCASSGFWKVGTCALGFETFDTHFPGQSLKEHICLLKCNTLFCVRILCFRANLGSWDIRGAKPAVTPLPRAAKPVTIRRHMAVFCLAPSDLPSTHTAIHLPFPTTQDLSPFQGTPSL